jgi:hypothetical protein
MKIFRPKREKVEEGLEKTAQAASRFVFLTKYY